MNIALWILAGAAIGWVGYSAVKANIRRGLVVSIIIGIAGGLLGGDVLAPMLGTVPGASNEINLFSLVVALAGATGCLTIGEMLSRRYGI
jgi:uncharacterized membrane protein YeaQ/YmgE (transglycosylase-associated protein family)